MGRPKSSEYPPYMSRDGDRGGFCVRNPLTNKKRRFGPDEEPLARETAAALAQYVEQHRRRMLFDAGRPTVHSLIEQWQAERLALQPWDTSTRETYLMRRMEQG